MADVPQYLPLHQFCVFAGVSRPTLTKRVRQGEVQPSAYLGRKPIFALGDLERVTEELNAK